MRRRRSDNNFASDMLPSFVAYHRFMLRKLGRLPKITQVFMIASFVVFVLFNVWVLYTMFSNSLGSSSFVEMDKCPACFGTHMCPDFYSGTAYLSGFSRLTFLHFLNAKNVFYGSFGDKEVVFKRLAHTSELQAFDERTCMKNGLPIDCDIRQAVNRSPKSGIDWLIQNVKGQSDMMACPSPRLFDVIMNYYVEKFDAVDLSYAEKVQLMTTLLINPEPIILQVFSQKESFPFPKYYGACGRIVAEEYVGHSLSSFFYSSWKIRAKLAYQVLRIADRFTDNNMQFALYWTDVNYDNLAVDRQGQIRVIDAENILVVDTWQIKQDAKFGWDEPYYAIFEECNHAGCSTEQQYELCQKYTTDYNYYVACRNLLSSYADFAEFKGGLLHDIPIDIEDRYALSSLLNLCAKPVEPGQRLKVKDELIDILKTISRET